jgi:hypothetical protein
MAYTPMAAGLLPIPCERVPEPDATMTVSGLRLKRPRLTVRLLQIQSALV